MKVYFAAALLAFTATDALADAERGAYLVNAVMTCDSCHTTRTSAGVAQNRFTGGPQTWDTPWYTVKGSNITPDKETGIGSWSDHDVKKALTEGVRPNGVPLAAQMPYTFYKILTPGDLNDIVAYIKTVPAVRNEVQPPSYKAHLAVPLIPGGERPINEAGLDDPVRRGFYLATIAHCMNCHAKGPDDLLNFQTGLGKGGHVMSGSAGPVVAANITSHRTKGVGSWTDDELKRALSQGLHREGRPLKPPMGARFSKMTERDIEAIVAWMRTIPPLE